jgi:hypothetical protein
MCRFAQQVVDVDMVLIKATSKLSIVFEFKVRQARIKHW